MENSAPSALNKFIVPVTIMLSFVSFWRAASIVLCDLGSSAYYVGGIAERAIGKAAPWFIFAIMLFSYAVRAVYIESCSMFVRGGVYRVVREAMGSTAAKFSVSALMFDYVLTGPISAVSAGLYLAGLINESGKYFSASWMHVSTPLFAVAFAILVTLYFWHTNRIGIPFSSTRALRIMQITTLMVAILIIWCVITIFTQGYQPVPPPTLANLTFNDESLGWLRGTIAPSITIVAILIGLGHSLLAMSGEESLAQVNREIAAPKHQNLMRTGFVIFIYSLMFTSLVSFFAVMIIPDAERSQYFDNLISGISIFLVGPAGLKLAFHAFVVLVGALILSGAVNTAIIGSNGVLNRVAEDGVLPEWFREPHNNHGTTHRIINLIVILQLLTIVVSRGNIYMLGEAYAFGVVWSFAMKALAVVVLRFTEPDVPRWRVPLNFRIRGIEVPLGLTFITVTLFLLASINALTKKTATISGITFTLVFFAAFTIFERRRQAEKREDPQGKARRVIEEGERERFRLEVRENLSPASLQVRPGNILVPVHAPDSLRHLQKVSDEFDPEKVDVVVLSVNVNAAEENRDLAMQAEQVVDNYETLVFSRVVHVAEKVGKPVSLVAAAGKEPYQLFLQAADKLRSSRIVVGLSSRLSGSQQQQELRLAWEQLPAPRPTVTLEIVGRNHQAPIQIDLGSAVSRPSEETRN
jgi:amino acid transporter